MEHSLTVVVFHFLFLMVDLFILINSFRHKNDSHQQNVFQNFTISVVVQQAFCTLVLSLAPEMWLPGAFLRNVFGIGLFIGMTAASYYWYMYLRELMTGGEKPTAFRGFVAAVPLLVMTVACLLTPWTHWVFRFDETGTYQRGSLMLLQMLCPYAYVIMAGILALVYRKRKERVFVQKILRYFLMFIVPSIVCVIIQLTLVRGGYTSIGISLGLIMMYLELYMEDVNESRRLKSVDSLNRKLQAVNEEQEAQLEEIAALNTELQEKQADLEESAAEQEAQYEEIAALNQSMQSQINMIQALMKVYFVSFYIDLENDTFREISNTEFVRKYIGSSGTAAQSMEVLCSKMVQPEYAEELRRFTDLSTLSERLKNKSFITCDYQGNIAGWCQIYFIPGIKNAEGNLKTVFLAARTIHDEKERELEQNRAIENARLAAEAANSAKTAFLFNMSHDIRTPMNAIIGFRELLEKHQDDPVRRADYLRKIEDASTVLLSIINNVLEMARIEKGTVQIEETVWSVDQFNDTLHSVFGEMMTAKGLTFTREIAVQHHYVFCDPIKLREIFINILSNAFKYTNAGGHVHMRLEELPSDRADMALYRTTVSDTGIGMSEEFLPHIFEEFSRENNTTDAKVEGTGLGMSIVKRLVEMLDGTIEVRSRKGEGTSFTITIPHRFAEHADLMKRTNTAVDPTVFRGKRILLAEDNDLNAEIAIEILSEAGFLIDRAADGRACVDMLKAAAPGYYDLILMDIQMPNMNGYAAARAIRQLNDPAKAVIKILALTANAFEEDKREAFNAGMNGHLAKPIDIRELMKTLAEILA